MSVLIKDMEMPKTHPLTVTIYPDGQVLSETVGAKDKHGIAVPVPTHGRLIDADEFGSIKYELPDGQKAFNRGFHSGVQYVQRLIMDAPTIIPAEEGET